MKENLRAREYSPHTLDARVRAGAKLREAAGVGKRQETAALRQLVFEDENVLKVHVIFGMSQNNKLSPKQKSRQITGTSILFYLALSTEHFSCCRRLLLFSLGDLLREFPLEALNASRRIDQLLLAGEEWVAIRADFDADDISGSRRACIELVAAAAAMDGYRMVIGVNSFFHGFSLMWR